MVLFRLVAMLVLFGDGGIVNGYAEIVEVKCCETMDGRFSTTHELL